MGGGTEQGNNSARGALTVTARVSNGASRYAMPSIPELVYAATLYKSTESPEYEKFVQGTKAADSDNLIFSFQRPGNTSGTFTLEVFAFVKADVVAENGTTTFSRSGAPFSKAESGLTITGDTINVGDIALEVNALPGLTGTVSLRIKVPEGCSLEIDDTAKTNFTCEKEGGSSDTYALTASGIPTDAYSVDFTVKKGEATVHIFTESINVLPGLCTDTWGGQAKGAAKDVTQSMSKTLYVRGMGGWYDTTSPYNDGETATASNNNLGSFSSPLATIQKAIDTVIAINDGSAYTICIDGTLTHSEAVAMATFTALKKELTLTIKALSSTATLDGGARFDENGTVKEGERGSQGRIIYAKPGTDGILNLTLENLVIKGGNSPQFGGGIHISDSTLKMKDCTVESNAAIGSDGGGGIYVNSGTLIMEGCIISGNVASVSRGGGVCLNSGTLKTEKCVFSGNISNGNGGAIYINTNAEATMTDDEIKGNASKSSGGGVYVNSGTFTMNGGTISDNTASNDGGGIYNLKGTLTMNGGTITGNTATANGGGVYVEAGTFTMSGGTIGGNTATTLGGGVYVAATSSAVGTFTMSGAASVPAGEDGKNDVYLSASGSNVATITIAGDLAASSPVVTITPSAYTAGRQVLSADNETIMQNNCDKFAVSKEGWEIIPNDTAGVLGISIYLNSSSGDDANSGLTASKAVKTLSKAIELFELQGAQKIMVCAEYTLPSEESTSLDRAGKSKLTFMRYTGKSDVSDIFKGTFFKVSQGDVTISNITLDGEINYDNIEPLLYISGSTMVVTLGDDAVICNNNDSGVYIDRGTFKMAGGEITQNRRNLGGGGVRIRGGTFEMSGGIISRNIGGNIAGGVYISGEAGTGGTFTMTGGKITGNYSMKGAGVGVYYSYSKFEMRGGTISGNQSHNIGGGVYVNGKFTMSGGEITGNTATDNGGGVYKTASGTFTQTGTGGTVSGNTPDDIYDEPSS